MNRVVQAGSASFGSIVGGSNPLERQRCAEEVAKRNVSGHILISFALAFLFVQFFGASVYAIIMICKHIRDFQLAPVPLLLLVYS